jgi:hypothetical protein
MGEKSKTIVMAYLLLSRTVHTKGSASYESGRNWITENNGRSNPRRLSSVGRMHQQSLLAHGYRTGTGTCTVRTCTSILLRAYLYT